MTINREHLAPCPFCGGEAETIECSDSSWYVMCATSKCGGQTPYGKTKPEAIGLWNTRAQAQAAPEAEPVEVVASAQKPIAILNLRDLFPSAHWSAPEHFFLWQITPDEVRALPREDIPLYTAPQHDADHIPDTTKMVDAELVEGGLRLEGLTDVSHQLGMLYLHFKNTDQLHVALREIRAKLATLSAKNEGVKA